VDENDKPVSGARIRIALSPSEDFSPRLKKNVSTDVDGRFEHSGVLPGSDYNVVAESVSMESTLLARKLGVASGETIDLGTINVSEKDRPKIKRTFKTDLENSATDAASHNPVANVVAATDDNPMATDKVDREDSAETRSYSGRVESPQGEPIAGAKIWLAVTSHEYNSEKNRENRKGLLRELATADEQGRFEVELDAATKREIRKRRQFSRAQLVATAQGRGLDWMPLEVFENDPEQSEKRKLLQTRIDKSLGSGRAP